MSIVINSNSMNVNIDLLRTLPFHILLTIMNLSRAQKESKERNEAEDRHQVLTEGEKDIFHAIMNRYLYVAACETTKGTNIKEYQTAKWREAAEDAENCKKRPIPHSLMSLPPHLCLNGRRYRTLAIKWAMGTFPPMSNSLLIERSGKCGQEAFTTIQEVLSKDVLTMQE